MKFKINNFMPWKLFISLCLVLFFMTGGVTAQDNTDQQQLDEINMLVNEVLEKSKIPGAAIAIIRDDEIIYYSYNSGNVKNSGEINEQSLFQIGSTTKAFTGLGILLLEDEGKLSLSDPVSMYIPWFMATYQGRAAEDLTISDCLYQISGYSNDERKYPSPTIDMTLEESIRNLSNRELESKPGQHYAYANTNYNILGLIIEVVSQQDYQSFMQERILQPLGLIHTEVYSEQKKQGGQLVPGSKLSFGQTYLFEIPVREGLIPSGYLISNTSDIGRWLQIQMGIIEISPQFSRIIEKSHIPNPSSMVDGESHYASGWFVDEGNGVIYHSGGTPNYSAKLAMKASDKIGVCVLTNLNAAANTNYLADNILLILEDKEITPYQHDIWYSIDTVFSMMTLIGVLLTGILIVKLVMIGRQINNNDRKKTSLNRKSLLYHIIPLLLLTISAVIIIVLPVIFKSDWLAMWLWAPVSLYSGIISLGSVSLLSLVVALITSIFPKVDQMKV